MECKQHSYSKCPSSCTKVKQSGTRKAYCRESSKSKKTEKKVKKTSRKISKKNSKKAEKNTISSGSYTYKELEDLVNTYDYSKKYLTLPHSFNISGKIERGCSVRGELLRAGVAGEVYEVSSKRVVKTIMHLRKTEPKMNFVEGLISKFAGEKGFGPKCYDFHYCEQDNHTQTVMEFEKASQTVEDYLKNHNFSKILKKVTKVIRKAHQHGILHMDLHIGNMMMMPGGDIKMIDFGGSFAFDLSDAKQKEIFEDVKFIDLFVFFGGLEEEELGGVEFWDFLKAYGEPDDEIERLYDLYDEKDDCQDISDLFINWKVNGKHPLVHLYGKQNIRERLQQLKDCCKCRSKF